MSDGVSNPAGIEGWWNRQPLLSEFQGSPLRCFVRYRWSIAFSASCVFVLALIILILGHYAGTNVLSVRMAVQLFSEPNTNPVVTLNNLSPSLAGYLANVIHGLFYLTIAPLSVWLGLHFVRQLNRTLRSLMSEKLLVPKSVADATRNKRPTERQISGDENAKFLTAAGNWNRKYFRFVPVVLLVMLIGFNLWRELRSWKDPAAMNGGIRSFGYMQAQFFADWKKEFEARSPEGQLEKLHSLEAWDEIKREIAQKVQSKDALRNSWAAAGFLKDQNDQLSANSYATIADKTNLATYVDFDKSLTAKYWRPEVSKFVARDSSAPMGSFYAFFGLVVLLEGSFHAFAIWLVCKFVFWLILIHRLLPPSKLPWELVPFFEDKKKQCNLAEVHKTYNFIVYAAGIGVLAYLLHRKGNQPNLDVDSAPFQINVMIGAFILIVVVALYVLPFWFNRKKIWPARRKAEAAASAELEDAPDREAEAKIRDRRDLIREQVTWPVGDKSFFRAVTAIGLAIAVPWLPFALPPPIDKLVEPVSKYGDLARLADMFTQWISVTFYGA